MCICSLPIINFVAETDQGLILNRNEFIEVNFDNISLKSPFQDRNILEYVFLHSTIKQ